MMTEHESKIIGFSTFLRVIAFVNGLVCVIAGSVFANETRGSDYYSYEYFNPSVLFLWTLGGVVSFIAWWSLSHIVAACDKYLMDKEQ